MASEIERKFLVAGDDWRRTATGSARYVQGYLAGGERSSVRIRVDGDHAWLNIKSATLSIERLEYEYAVPLADGEEMLARLCEGALVEKRRWFVPWEGKTWEVDVFEGGNEGLVVAEIELERADEPFSRPPWLGDEVSQDHRYYNVWLARHPYTRW